MYRGLKTRQLTYRAVQEPIPICIVEFERN